MKLDQIAYCCNDEASSNLLKVNLGLQDARWIVDRVTAKCTVWGQTDHINIAMLQFCDVLGVQFEIIRYIRGHNWLEAEHDQVSPFLSHVGYHLDAGEPFPECNTWELAQEARTMSHTSEHLTLGAAAGRRYHYKIFRVSPHTYMKFIRRIEPGKVPLPHVGQQ